MSPDSLLLAPSTRLIHVGPYKTGTTALQNAFHASRHLLKAHGVLYAGPGTQPMQAALSVTGKRGRKGDRAPVPKDWDDLVREVRAAGTQRVVISSEFLCSGDDAAARRVVRELGSGPVHVVLTLRPISKIAPSQWQQYMQNGVRIPYVDWLEAMFRGDRDGEITPSFWERHDHAVQIRRWADIVGPDNLTVVVVDDSDRDMLLRTFESFVGLPEGLLRPQKDTANRSLTQAEAELVRLVNVHYYENGWPNRHYAKFVREGIARKMKTRRRPDARDSGLTMPEWALTEAAEVGRRVVETIESTGVHVVGDPSTLAVDLGRDNPGGQSVETPETIPVVAAGLAVLGAMAGRRKTPPGAEVAAALSLVGALAQTDDHPADEGLPHVRIEHAASAVIGVLEGQKARAQYRGVPRVAPGVAAVAALAAAKSGGTDASRSDLITARRLIDAITTEPAPQQPGTTTDDPFTEQPTKTAATKAPTSRRTVQEAIWKKPIEDATATELLTVVFRRGQYHLRQRLRR